MLAAAFAPAFVVRPAPTHRLYTRQQAPCYCMAQPPAAASNETMSGEAWYNWAFDSFGLRAHGGASGLFRTPDLHSCARFLTSGEASAAKERQRFPAGDSTAFCRMTGAAAVCPALAYAEAADAGHAVESALPALDSPQPGAASRLPLAQATALVLAYAEQRSRRGGGDRAKRKCGPGSFGSVGGEAAHIEDASDGSLRWVRA